MQAPIPDWKLANSSYSLARLAVRLKGCSDTHARTTEKKLQWAGAPLSVNVRANLPLGSDRPARHSAEKRLATFVRKASCAHRTCA
eukprot:1291878-Pleurochrysis_carterae.AAC.3